MKENCMFPWKIYIYEVCNVLVNSEPQQTLFECVHFLVKFNSHINPTYEPL